MNDYSNFYATASQVIPVLLLVFVIEGQGFRKGLLRQSMTRVMRRTAGILMFIALLGEFLALVALSQGSPAPDRFVAPVVLATGFSIMLAGWGLILVIGKQQDADEDSPGS